MFKIFRRTFKPFLLENKYRVVPAFSLKGVDYYMFDDTMQVPAGRMMAALMVYNEMEMKADKRYLEMHVQAMDKILSDPKKINLTHVVRLNMNLKERLELAVLPDFIYKLASVIFFDKTESPYSYDYDYNEKKIKAWKEDKDTLGFFLQMPLKDLIPSWNLEQGNISMYLGVADQVAKIHQLHLTDILSEKQ